MPTDLLILLVCQGDIVVDIKIDLFKNWAGAGLLQISGILLQELVAEEVGMGHYTMLLGAINGGMSWQ